MRHRMTLDNGRTGNRYVLTLEDDGEAWNARWHAISMADGRDVSGSRGSRVAASADGAFDEAKQAIEELDEDVIGVDWQFEEPLPPWLTE